MTVADKDSYLRPLRTQTEHQPFSRNTDLRPDKPPALRIVHLAGGLRAADVGEDRVHLEVSPQYRFGHFPTPAYSALYAALTGLGFSIIGVEFLTNHAFAELSPPDWETVSPGKGFASLSSEQHWSRIRHAANRDKNPVTSRIASRIGTYLRLTNLRVYELSRAYNSCLNMAVQQPNKVEVGHGFGNQWIAYVDASIHGFLSDAASFRDILSEAIWRLVLRSTADSVHTLRSFLKIATESTHPLSKEVFSAARPQGWLYQLKELRNAVVHVAPIADSQEHHFAQIRALHLEGGHAIKHMHFPLLSFDGQVRLPENLFVDYSDEGRVLEQTKSYFNYLGTSQDGLAVCHRLHGELVALSEKIRLAAGLQEQQLKITDEDLVGPVSFY